ncbi:hypothetical protein, partial [Parasutterella sp.]|uniref:hypothetical protein n=1 Tax=Parasutterella sp. TaxID=2049037 RepID=UPI003AB1BF9B
FFSYWIGVQDGRDSEELKNARSEIIQLRDQLVEAQSKHQDDAIALADLRVAESRSRDDAEWMRQQLSEIERAAKTDSDRRYNRCLRLAAKGKELLDRAEIAIKFCSENHK